MRGTTSAAAGMADSSAAMRPAGTAQLLVSETPCGGVGDGVGGELVGGDDDAGGGTLDGGRVLEVIGEGYDHQRQAVPERTEPLPPWVTASEQRGKMTSWCTNRSTTTRSSPGSTASGSQAGPTVATTL